MTRRTTNYTTEFKNEAASLVLDKDYSIDEACTAIGIGATALRRWTKQLAAERGGETPKAKALTTDQQKIQALEARIKQIEWEKDILKKATALLMSEGIRQ